MEKILLYDKIEEGDIVRFHFRYLADRNTFLYSRLCVSFPEQIDPSEHEPSEMKYGDLIEAAYKTRRNLIYSVNKCFCKNKLKDKWSNFLTVVPLFEGNDFQRKYADTVSKPYPFITFGVTVNSEKFNSLLYCMDYFFINKMLEEIINTYIRIFKIDIDRFCVWARNELKKENFDE